MTDARRPGPSLYISVCGRRDAVMPRNVQTDPEAAQAWLLKDEIVRRGRVYYAKLARGKAMFIAPRLLPHFRAVWGVRKVDEPRRLRTHLLGAVRDRLTAAGDEVTPAALASAFVEERRKLMGRGDA